jgi:hypothetical protein
MGKFTRVTPELFDELQVDAGILLTDFDPSDPASLNEANIICATTGGINPQCIATYEDLFEDVDNAPNNTMEGKKLTGWDCKIGTTAIGISPRLLKLSLGAADAAGKRVVPRRDLKQSDFSTLWWVGDLANGGFAAIKLLHALSTGGFALQTAKNGKGQVSLEITGHASINAINKVPMEFFVAPPTEYTITNTLTKATNSNTDTKAVLGNSYLAALTPDTGYAFAANAVSVTMGGTDITSTAYDDGIIVIDEVTGNIAITATATAVT